MPFAGVVEAALYDADYGFYVSGGAAGRQGDFITSPEVGPLFGTVVAAALDAWWRALECPDPFVVADIGAGPGTLARSVRAAAPECLAALDYRSVDPYSAAASDDVLPAEPFVGVILANELLDNLPFGLAERAGGRWHEIHVDVVVDVAAAGDAFVEVLGPIPEVDAAFVDQLVPDAPDGARVPLQRAAMAWLAEALTLLEAGRVVVIDYADTTPSLATRPSTEWLRTYRGHQRGGPPLAHLGTQDITCEVATDQLAAERAPASDRSQAEFLGAYGIAELVDEGRRIWTERAHIGDLQALKARSRVNEAAALTDPTGLGAFRVLEWPVG